MKNNIFHNVICFILYWFFHSWFEAKEKSQAHTKRRGLFIFNIYIENHSTEIILLLILRVSNLNYLFLVSSKQLQNSKVNGLAQDQILKTNNKHEIYLYCATKKEKEYE